MQTMFSDSLRYVCMTAVTLLEIFTCIPYVLRFIKKGSIDVNISIKRQSALYSLVIK